MFLIVTSSFVDLLSLQSVELLGNPNTVYRKNPSPLHITLTVANLLGIDLVSGASNKTVIEVKVGLLNYMLSG